MNNLQVRALRISPASILRQAPHTQIARHYATQSNLGSGPRPTGTSRKKSITVLSDDGRVQWGDLSTGEKFARTTQQSFNFVIVLAGAVLTV
jgi:import inner membrane translocase subunit TIM21